MDLPFDHAPQSLTCPVCSRKFTTKGGLTRHYDAQHHHFTPASDDEDENKHQTDSHPKINGRPCNAEGNYLPPHSPPPPLASPSSQAPGSWEPFKSRTEFDFTYFHFVQAQSPASTINTVLDLWAAQLATTDFKGQISYAPHRQFNGEGKRVWSNLFSGDWAWKQADIISEDEGTHGAMFVPVDKPAL
ncbi:hypothetical protein B0H17DRAFT_1209910 [Mycena rosella]|uniref:C2H2-type domain-containing protein n=1 Tax=Mycena rosella TaxID=1033263 RepID=A0AAD7CXA9_MYCRO|nr:hypothetical protein B0H17DRAFT_1209910 [Mycena rosella]